MTPYILQTWFAPLINIGGRPGRNLMKPFYVSNFLSAISVFLVRTHHPNYWCLRKLGNAVSSPPVVKTLNMFNSVTTRGSYHDGRGSILSQSLKVVEYWFSITQILWAIGFAFYRRNAEKDYNQLDHLLAAFREIAFVSDWTRICAHAIFINQLDELYLTSPTSTSSVSSHHEDINGRDPEVPPSQPSARGTSLSLVARR